MLSKTITKVWQIQSRIISKNIFGFMAKPSGKDVKKQQPQPQPIVQPTRQQIIRKYLTPIAPTLSPSQKQYMQNGFEDLSVEQKQSLQKIAENILQLDTRSFMALQKWGGLGTQPFYYVATQKLTEQQIKQGVRNLRKEN